MTGWARAFALAAAALVACVAFAVWSRLSPLPGTGFTERVTPGLRCDGEARTSIVREPFVAQLADGSPRCVQWTASFVARTKMRAHVETMLEGSGSVSLDGHVVVADEDAIDARSKGGLIDLAPGVHSFAASFRSRGGPVYFRVSMDDELDPHDETIIAPLDDDAFYPRQEDARQALATPPPRERPAWNALAAALALACAGALAWLAIRARRGLGVPRVNLLAGTAVFATGLFVRARGLALQDVSWDELTYVTAGRHYVRNVLLGDWFAEAWRHNFEHAPNTKWILGLGELLGGLEGARMFVSVMGALAAAFVYGFGRIAFGRAVGVTAAFLTALLPILVAHGRIAGHDTMVLFWWCASMLGMACWLESPRERRDPLAAFACVFAATAGVFSRATTVWIFPVLVTAWLVDARGPLGRRIRTFPLAGLAGGGVAAALVFAVWPFMWSHQAERVARIKGHWGVAWGDIEVYMGKLCLPAWHYFTVAFLSETPAVVLAAAAAGFVVALQSTTSRSERGVTWVTVLFLWVVCPFGQTVSTLRIGAGRYVIQAWPGLLLFAAIALVALGDFAASLAFDLSKRGRALVRAGPSFLAVAYVGVALAHVEPYPLDYFNEFVGGPSGVAARRMFEVPWWGEGNLAAVAGLNRVATSGARVRLALWPTHDIPRLRDDLVAVDDATTADYVLVSHLQYFAKPPPGCTNIGTVDVAGAPLVDSYHCSPASPTDLGFAAMTRGAPDQALPLFRDALQRDPRNPAALFGLGWAAQVKGNQREAESSYIQAASRAAQANDLETEYFARFDLGTLYAQQGRNDEAVTAFRAALALVNRAPARFADRAWNLWFNLGRALAASGHTDEARSTLERARSMRPDDPSIADALKSLPPAVTAPPPSATPVRSSDPPASPPRR